MAALMGLALMLQVGLVDGGGSLLTDPPEPAVEEVVEEVTPASPYAYLYASYPSLARRMDCVIQRESRWDPGAYNPRSGAAGLAQFLLSTWQTTPQGKAGASRYNPYAAIDAAAWLATHSGWQHWVPVLQRAC